MLYIYRDAEEQGIKRDKQKKLLLQTETMTKIFDLPTNLVEEILSKIPFKYMREVRLTCKQWDTLSKSRSFSKMHIDKLSEIREGESMMVAWIDYDLYLMRVLLVDNRSNRRVER